MPLIDELKKLSQEDQPQSLDELFQGSKEGIMTDNVVSQINALLPAMERRILGGMETLVKQAVLSEIQGINIPQPRDGRDGADGKTPTKREIKAIVKEVVPAPKEADLSFVDELKKRFSDLENRLTSIASRRTKGGGGGGSTMKVENLSSQVDGSTTSFTLTNTASGNHLLFYTGFPSVVIPSTDYTISGTTLTISTFTPASGQALAIIYERAD